MPSAFPDAACIHPITLPGGGEHHGTVFLNNVIEQPNFVVRDYTYASDFDPPDGPGWASRLAPYLFAFSAETLRIGRFCQIAHGVRFITTSANHATQGVSTFPFPIFAPERMASYQPDHRDTIIGHDVWLGYGARVMPGARIGNGVIVGAGTVVRGTVPDYAIVTGNPAQILRMRFDERAIATLNRIAWWDWPVERIAYAQNALQAADISALERFASEG